MAEGTYPTATEPATVQADLAEPGGAPTEPAPELARSSVILGRALLDRDGELWPQDPDEPGYWKLPAGDASLPRDSIEAAHAPVREVLLVSPAGGRVFDAAGRWYAAERAVNQYGAGNEAVASERDAAERGLFVAIGAMIREHPAAPAPCCDLHGRNCESPSELCCWECTEARHPDHPADVVCIWVAWPFARAARTSPDPGTSPEVTHG